MEILWSVTFLGLFFGRVYGALQLASYYSDHMVLQRGPQRAVLWGTADTEGDTVTAQVTGQGSPVTTTVQNGTWKLKLPAITEPGPFVIDVRSSDGHVTLRDVLFGDVWLCSGQSNMQLSMNQIMNSTQEIQNATLYENIRMLMAGFAPISTPQSNLHIDQQWTKPTTNPARAFSAVCLLFAEYLQPHLNYPIGIIEAARGGTPIEAWSPAEALSACPPVHWDDLNPYGPCCPHASSVLWNGMLNPLASMTIYGVLWYQGEENNEHSDLYACQIKELLSQWRTQFNRESLGQTSSKFPFGYVQLAPFQNLSYVGGFPPLRWAQTAGFGYSPNPSLPNTFMAVAMDLPDFDAPLGPIHPRFKQEVAERLLLGALNVAYGRNDVTFQGPFPTSFTGDAAQHRLTVEYDHGHTPLQVRSTTGLWGLFQVCCSQSNAHTCDSSGNWEHAPVTGSDASHVTVDTSRCGSRHLVGFRYAWKTTPCAFLQCAVYAMDSGLPAPPYITNTLAV